MANNFPDYAQSFVRTCRKRHARMFGRPCGVCEQAQMKEASRTRRLDPDAKPERFGNMRVGRVG